MSIRFRLNVLMVTLLSLALLALLGAMVMSAGPRIRAENDSMMRLAKEFVETAVESLQGTSDPGERLAVMLAGLRDLRHVRIYRAEQPLATAATDAGGAGVHDWLAEFAQPEHRIEVPVIVNGHNFGELVIAPQASDESAEIFDSIVKFSVIGTVFAVATLLLMSLMIARLLKPIMTFGEALMELHSGKYDVAVPEGGPPEVADISRKLNRLAATLKVTVSENRRLAERIVCVQDEERKDLARELHDELGPYLFAIRAGASMIRAEIEKDVPDKPKLTQSCTILLDRIETMQRTNLRVLQKLRPIGLEEIGLEAKLDSLVAMWRENHPEVDINLDFSEATPERDETSNLTIYRIVQEGLTNAFRHADASTIEISIEPISPYGDIPATRNGNRPPSLKVSVTDNGKGLAEQVKPNYGIAGMSERVWATGGDLRIVNRPGGGVTLEAWLPAMASI
jgi:two-component system, NarL family, sensor histidine kinase UhpB